MTNLILEQLPESIRKEFHCDEDGKGFVSLRGLARLCGVKHNSWGRGGSKFTKSIDEMLIQRGIDFSEVVASDVPDTVSAVVIAYYAQLGIKTAQTTLITFAAIGLRALIQQATDYKPPLKQKLTAEQIIELCCLPCPTTWQRRFPVEYYEHLSRLTGLITDGIERPMLWARLTKELVYDYLPPGIYDEVKRCKAETGSWEKLHQFLSEDGIAILETHQRRVLEHMQGAASLTQLKTTLKQACTGQYQLVLRLKSS